MKLNRRRFLAATAATLTMPATIDFASAEEKVIRFAMPQDFTRVYTFVTAEYTMSVEVSTAIASSPTSPTTVTTFRARSRPMKKPSAKAPC